MNRSAREPLILLGLTAIALIVSGIHPYDRTTWILEVAPVLIGAPILIATYRRFPLTPLLYRLLFLHAPARAPMAFQSRENAPNPPAWPESWRPGLQESSLLARPSTGFAAEVQRLEARRFPCQEGDFHAHAFAEARGKLLCAAAAVFEARPASLEAKPRESGPSPFPPGALSRFPPGEADFSPGKLTFLQGR